MEQSEIKQARGMSTVIPGKTTTITHNLGTTNVIISLYNTKTGNELNSGITILDENSVMITTSGGTPDEIKVVIVGF